MILLLAVCFLLTGCQKKKNTYTPTYLYVKDEMPLRMTYERMWVYSAYGESEEEEYLSETKARYIKEGTMRVFSSEYFIDGMMRRIIHVEK